MNSIQRHLANHWVHPDAPGSLRTLGACPGAEALDRLDLGTGAAAGKSDPSVRSLPTNLKLPGTHKPSGRLKSAGLEALFAAGCLTLVAGCTVAAVIPNLVGKIAHEGFSESQIEEMKSVLKPGDIVLTRSLSHRSFNYLVHSAFGHHFSHAATYVGNGQIIDSYDKPDRQDISVFFKTMNDVCVLRPRYESQEQIDRSIQYLDQQIGKKYDLRFKTDDVQEFYCSELTLRGLEASGSPLMVPGHQVLGHPFVLPEDFRNTPGIDLVKIFHSEE